MRNLSVQAPQAKFPLISVPIRGSPRLDSTSQEPLRGAPFTMLASKPFEQASAISLKLKPDWIPQMSYKISIHNTRF